MLYSLRPLCFLVIFLIAAVYNGNAQSVDASHYVPADKNLDHAWKASLWADTKKVYKGEELKTIGMPCGGIAAGQLYVTGDGTLANWWIANNAYNTGYGIDWLLNFETPNGPWKVCYQTFEPMKYVEQGFTIRVEQGGKSWTKNLDKKGFDDISFVGEYPIAKINYASKSAPSPLKIDATVFSPFIPMNARESATPATLLRYKLQNTSATPMTVSLNGWLQNLVCVDLKDEARGESRNRVIRENGVTSVFMDLIEDKSFKPAARRQIRVDNFESGSLSFWTAEGTAFGKAPVKDAERAEDQQPVNGFTGKYYINSFVSSGGDDAKGKLTSKAFTVSDDYLNFRIGGGAHAGKTCMNLLVQGKVVRSATGENSETLRPSGWDVKEFRGKEAILEIVDNEDGGWGHINVDEIVLSNLPAKEFFFPKGHPYFGNLSLSVFADDAYGDANYSHTNNKTAEAESTKKLGDKMLGSVGSTFTLQAGETREVTFALSWFFPNRPMQYGDGGNWNRAIPTEGPAIGNMYANWFTDSKHVAHWLHDNLERLSEKTFAFHDSYYNNSGMPYWLAQRIMMPVSTLATETCQWWANDKFWAWEGVGSCVGTCTHVWNYEQALAHLFPELERNIREKTDYATSFREDGGILARNGWGGILIDGHAGGILKAYREHLRSKDDLFLNRNWDKIKKATEFIIAEDQNEDGLIEKEQANTYDIAFYGANTYVGGLYLSALKAATVMAGLMNDTAFVSKCNRIFESGSKLSVDRLWNGQYFIQDVDLEKHKKFQYATGCLSDQLFGQTWAHLYGLGYIYPEHNVKTALRSIWKYNWAREVGVQTKNHKPERVYADADEPGLLIATWPFNKHMGEDGVRYRDEVWTGIEYQVATNMIYDGMVDEGLSLVKAVHMRYDPKKHNPWNEIECGDHYARALASWGVLVAMQRYEYNGPAKSLRFNPVKGGNFSGFFTAAEGWGNFARAQNGNSTTDTLSVRYGRLALAKLELPRQAAPKKVSVKQGDKTINASHKFSAGIMTVELDAMLDETAPLVITSN